MWGMDSNYGGSAMPASVNNRREVEGSLQREGKSNTVGAKLITADIY